MTVAASEPLDIRSGELGPAGILGNFAPHPFELDGSRFACMEAFLQGLKVADAQERERVYALDGWAAKAEGQKHDWTKTGVLWWQGRPLDRYSQAYQDLLDRAYAALCEQNEDYRNALIATGDRPLVHTVGKDDPNETVLTTEEFCSRLTKLREQLKPD